MDQEFNPETLAMQANVVMSELPFRNLVNGNDFQHAMLGQVESGNVFSTLWAMDRNFGPMNIAIEVEHAMNDICCSCEDCCEQNRRQ